MFQIVSDGFEQVSNNALRRNDRASPKGAWYNVSGRTEINGSMEAVQGFKNTVTDNGKHYMPDNFCCDKFLIFFRAGCTPRDNGLEVFKTCFA